MKNEFNPLIHEQENTIYSKNFNPPARNEEVSSSAGVKMPENLPGKFWYSFSSSPEEKSECPPLQPFSTPASTISSDTVPLEEHNLNEVGTSSNHDKALHKKKTLGSDRIGKLR